MLRADGCLGVRVFVDACFSGVVALLCLTVSAYLLPYTCRPPSFCSVQILLSLLADHICVFSPQQQQVPSRPFPNPNPFPCAYSGGSSLHRILMLWHPYALTCQTVSPHLHSSFSLHLPFKTSRSPVHLSLSHGLVVPSDGRKEWGSVLAANDGILSELTPLCCSFALCGVVLFKKGLYVAQVSSRYCHHALAPCVCFAVFCIALQHMGHLRPVIEVLSALSVLLLLLLLLLADFWLLQVRKGP